MAYTITNSLGLGPAETGKTVVAALIDTVGNPVEGLTSSVVEVGGGWYMATHSVPDGQRGGISYAIGGTVVAFLAVNPEEVMTPAREASIAETLLAFDWESVGVTVAARSVMNALRFLRNKKAVVGTTLTVTEEDDLTTAWTAALSTDPGAEPVTAMDPA